MAESITSRVLDALANAGLMTVEQIMSINDAAATAGVNAGQVLLQRGIVSASDIEGVMEAELGIPRVDLSSYAPDDEALAIVDVSIARAHNILPLFEIESMLTVAIGDPMDVFILDDLAARLSLEIEAVLSDSADVRGAIVQYYGDLATTAPAAQPDTDVPPVAPYAEAAVEIPADSGVDAADFFEAPLDEQMPVVAEPISIDAEPELTAEERTTIEQVVETPSSAGLSDIDLDVLAVADTHKVSALVSEILEHAVRAGASRIHLFPYKDDFFLVYRVQGRLERVSSAPLSLQGALVDGFKSFARLGGIASTAPALGRVKATVGDRNLVLTVSAVPTIAGQRVVVSLAGDKPAPRGLDTLGMNEAETKALHAMVERGRGILLVCGPVAGGRSSTYYALLHYAAQVGKTVYSVERSIDFEIPAVAQVLVSPGSPVGAESYFAAGMRQDTDVVAIDAMQSVEDVHLAIEAAGTGKLVIATFSGADIVSGVRRMLDLGAEPVSLASALTLGVGQRLVRTNCPQCAAEETSLLADMIPGAEPGMTIKRSAGCPACANSGYQGVTCLFEVLPFTEKVRGPIARGATAEDLAAAARAAGMRPMIASGLTRVREGLVSPEELDRVMRFSE
jgi:type II secretory ATPase GspE/PulE/Tfp pilus assembly ATPase PilB-like protein